MRPIADELEAVIWLQGLVDDKDCGKRKDRETGLDLSSHEGVLQMDERA